MNNFTKSALVIAGSFSVGMGIVGIFLPILPTTPFLLLGAACYVKSSDKLYCRLINNRWLGSYIKNYREGNGIALKVKLLSIALLWLTVGWSVIMVVTQFFIKVMLFLIASGVTFHIISIKTLKPHPTTQKRTET